jgi:hypothetical protein
LGIDESIVRIRKRDLAFIYVGAFTKDVSQGEEEKQIRKIRDIDENTKFNLTGLSGFLFGVFLFNKQKKRDSQTENYKQFLSVYTLIQEGLDSIEDLGYLEAAENVKFCIDGHDVYRIGDNLEQEISKTRFAGRTKLNFIAHGDRKIKIINHADMIAYALRRLDSINDGLDYDLQERGKIALLNEKNPQTIKKLLSHHLAFKTHCLPLEKIVA